MSMRKVSRSLIWLLPLASASLVAKEWCEVPGKGGYFADKCPAGTASKVVADPKPKQEEWQPRIGMTQAEVMKVIESKDCWDRAFRWCGSHKVNRTENARGTHEQWVFGNERLSWYLYFDDGVLTTIQE
ncbi:MAG: hypothetical protein J0I77_17840 [Rudaea sp.]|uniref:hypothetical protein n=1 Tax=unclassified Rudaea TaxID=2627037 RepID=UPI0014858A36|nr:MULTISPECIES: hypothetical protein [unclassified Rudaea]MBN8887591.1 hypothetical protein [Rudaea sp.]